MSASISFNKGRFCRSIYAAFESSLRGSRRVVKEDESEDLAKQILAFLKEVIPDEADAVEDALEVLVDTVEEESKDEGGMTSEQASEVAKTAVVEFSKAFLAKIEDMWGLNPNSGLLTDAIDALAATYKDIDEYIRIEET